MDIIREVGVKTLYLPDGRQASSWVREIHKGLEKVDVPYLKSGLSVGDNGYGYFAKGALMGVTSAGNSLVHSQTQVYFTSSASTHEAGFSVMEGEGWRRAIAVLAARDLSRGTWINDKDEYLVPNTYREVG